jgi:hypothetical protein
MLVEYYQSQTNSHTILDMDTENNARVSLVHFFPTARKINMHTGRAGRVYVLDEGTPIVIADRGAGGGAAVQRWFSSMFTSVAQRGVVSTAIGVVTPDPARVESVLPWAAALQNRAVLARHLVLLCYKIANLM